MHYISWYAAVPGAPCEKHIFILVCTDGCLLLSHRLLEYGVKLWKCSAPNLVRPRTSQRMIHSARRLAFRPKPFCLCLPVRPLEILRKHSEDIEHWRTGSERENDHTGWDDTFRFQVTPSGSDNTWPLPLTRCSTTTRLKYTVGRKFYFLLHFFHSIGGIGQRPSGDPTKPLTSVQCSGDTICVCIALYNHTQAGCKRHNKTHW